MEVKFFTHIRVLYIFVFGLYFGLFALMYCNFAIWWKVQSLESIDIIDGCCGNGKANNEDSKTNIALVQTQRKKRSRSYRAVSLYDTRLINSL